MKGPDYIDRLVAQHREAIMAEIKEPVEDTEDNPVITFWALVRAGAELDRQMASNEGYYAAGYCGGCETCGNSPFPWVPDDARDTFLARMREQIAAVDEYKAQAKTPAVVTGGGPLDP